jgi:hypothetical protein
MSALYLIVVVSVIFMSVLPFPRLFIDIKTKDTTIVAMCQTKTLMKSTPIQTQEGMETERRHKSEVLPHIW